MNQTAATVAPWVEGLARLGYASNGVVYTIIGGLAAGAAYGGRGNSRSDSDSAFRVIADQPFGKILISVAAIGLLGYAAWRIISAITDSERLGSTMKGIAMRAGGFFGGVLYLFLALAAARVALGQRGGGGSDEKAESLTARLMSEPFGMWMVSAAGLAIAAYGAFQLYLAWKAKLGSQLRLQWVTERFKRRLVAISRFGIAARGAVFILIGISIARAAWDRDPNQATGTSGALQQVGAFSMWLLAVVAVGLIAYGVYQFLNARYRLIAA